MVFADLNFIFIFLPVFLGSYFLFSSIKYRNLVLFIFSLFFYAWGEPAYVALMIVAVLFNYGAALLIGQAGERRRTVLVAAVATDIVLIGVFKYLDFFISNINMLTGARFRLPGLPLPLGISFYTFQLISYVCDVYRERSRPQKNIITLGAYLAGFPQLVAGPIIRYETIARQLVSRRTNICDFSWGTRRFITGLAKKVIIANNMAFIVDNLLRELPVNYGVWGAWFIAIAFALQIYYDFSGYSDMAIGMGRMLGFQYPENFNYPYIARTITEFWRRWHMSLTAFFREYLYIPLGGSHVRPVRWIWNMLIVWTLTGFWHGAQWNFVLFGLYFGVILILEKTILRKILNAIGPFWARLYTIVIYLIGGMIFRIEDLASLQAFAKTLIGGCGAGHLMTYVYAHVLQVHVAVIFIFGIILVFPVAPRIAAALYRSRAGSIMADLWFIVLLAVSVILLQCGEYQPFIYFRF